MNIEVRAFRASFGFGFRFGILNMELLETERDLETVMIWWRLGVEINAVGK